MNGERSGLFFRFVDALKQARPKYFLLENVASMPKEEKDTITEILGVEPILINSALLSAQNRKRLYWTNIKNVAQPENLQIFLKDIVETGETTDDKADCLTANYGKKSFNADFTKKRATFISEPILQPLPCASRTWPRIKDGRPRVKRVEVKTDGKANSLTRRDTDSMILEPINKRILRVELRKDGKANALTSNTDHSQVLEQATTEKRGTVIKVSNKTVTTKNGVAYPIELPDGEYLIRKLTPVECERLQTLPDNYTAHVSNTQRYKAIGNGWTVDVIAHILKHIGG